MNNLTLVGCFFLLYLNWGINFRFFFLLQVVSLFYIAFVAGAQLSNNYLPPGNAKTAGGNGRFLATPFQGSSSFSSSGARFNSGYGGGSIIRFNNNNNGDGSYSFE